MRLRRWGGRCPVGHRDRCGCRLQSLMAHLAQSALAVLALSFSLAISADAQTSSSPKRVGVLLVGIGEQSEETKAFQEGLRNAGYVEGRDIAIEWWFGRGRYDLLAEAAADLVRRTPDVIVMESTMAALAAKRATSTIPIVLALVSDPVGSGLVVSLAHPGGNVTGLTNQTVDFTAKRLQWLKEAIPGARRVTVIFNPETPPNKIMISRLQDGGTAGWRRVEIHQRAKGEGAAICVLRVEPIQY